MVCTGFTEAVFKVWYTVVRNTMMVVHANEIANGSQPIVILFAKSFSHEFAKKYPRGMEMKTDKTMILTNSLDKE